MFEDYEGVELRSGIVLRLAGLVFALAVASVFMAAPTSAEPRCDGQACVPNVGQGAEIGAPCASPERYIFATKVDGDLAACVYAGADSPRWVDSVPLVGVRDEYSSCPLTVGGTAQSPDGIALLCVSNVSDGGGYWVRGP
jgi:hypothetical protein